MNIFSGAFDNSDRLDGCVDYRYQPIIACGLEAATTRANRIGNFENIARCKLLLLRFQNSHKKKRRK